MKILLPSSAGLLLVALGSLLAVACGSEVEGSGGSGSGSNSSASVGGDPITAAQGCNDYCHKMDTLNCSPGDCGMQCAVQLEGIPPECETDLVNLYTCLLKYTTDCSQPTMCADAENVVESCVKMYGCVGGTCENGVGMNGESSCGCDDTCKGKKYSTNCTTPAGGTMTTCDCLVDNMSVGTCTQADANACGTKTSCCNAMYFKL